MPNHRHSAMLGALFIVGLFLIFKAAKTANSRQLRNVEVN
jgi:hypothetical protein